jgi:hypothetical protein
VTPRLGLQGGGAEGDVQIGPDTSVLQAPVQAPVTGSCLESEHGSIDAAISAITQNGTVTCNPDDTGPAVKAFSGFWDGPEPLPLEPNTGHLPTRSPNSRCRRELRRVREAHGWRPSG